MTGPISWYHQQVVHQRRVRVLARHFADLIVLDAQVLDVGCGDGQLASEIGRLRPDLCIRGIDVLVRDKTAIPVEPFDGRTIPMETDSVDTVIMVDVLHHTEDPDRTMKEAARVARQQIVIKDHYLKGIAAWSTLAFMDHVGNARHGVDIPCHYLKPKEWEELYESANVNPTESRTQLGIYPPPLSWCFERSLHFISVLEPQS